MTIMSIKTKLKNSNKQTNIEKFRITLHLILQNNVLRSEPKDLSALNPGAGFLRNFTVDFDRLG